MRIVSSSYYRKRPLFRPWAQKLGPEKIGGMGVIAMVELKKWKILTTMKTRGMGVLVDLGGLAGVYGKLLKKLNIHVTSAIKTNSSTFSLEQVFSSKYKKASW